MMIIENANIELDRDSKIIICEGSHVKNCGIVVSNKGTGSHPPIEVLPHGIMVYCSILNALERDCILLHDGAVFDRCGVFKYKEEEEEESLWGNISTIWRRE